MGKINGIRFIIAGLVAGIVADVLGYLVDGVLLAPRWAAGMTALGHGSFSPDQIYLFNLAGLAAGFVAIWIYVVARSHFGAGPVTAIKAGVAAWILGTLLPNLSFMVFTGLFSRHLALYTTLGGLVEVVVGTVAGAALYKDA